MSVICIVQARMGSTRLPGKVLADVAGRPMLGLMLDRLASLDLAPVIVATTDLPADDPVADLVTSRGMSVVRGSAVDVLGRFCTAIDRHTADHVVRLTADCPLIDPILVRSLLELHLAVGSDYTSNTLIRDFPDGLDAEVVRTSVLRMAAAEASGVGEREHVTPFVYRRPERFRLRALRGAEFLGAERWTIDLPEDLARLRELVGHLSDPLAPWQEVLAVAGRSPTPDPFLRPASAGDANIHPDLLEHLEDPSVRFWVFEEAGEVTGWASIAVTGGVGDLVLGGEEPELVQEHVLRWLSDYDHQVVELRLSGPGGWRLRLRT